MIVPSAIQLRAFGGRAALAGWVAAAGAAAGLLVADPEPAVRHPAVRLTAWAFVGSWAAAAAAMLQARPGEWGPLSPRLRFARRAWTLGLVMHAGHVLVAFGWAHDWSHAAAVRHVAAAGGFGAGIAANYVFLAVWLGDAGWWWADPAGYSRRPRRVGHAAHGYMTFLLLNATVVFGAAEARAAGAVLFVWLGVVWRRR